MDIYELYDQLLHAWSECPIREQEPIEQALRVVRHEMSRVPVEEKELRKELSRFDGFKNDQTDYDNLLSLMKIAKKLDIDVDMDIDLHKIDIDDIISYLKVCVKNKSIAMNEFNKSEYALKCMWGSSFENEVAEKDMVLSPSGLKLSDIVTVVPYFRLKSF